MLSSVMDTKVPLNIPEGHHREAAYDPGHRQKEIRSGGPFPLLLSHPLTSSWYPTGQRHLLESFQSLFGLIIIFAFFLLISLYPSPRRRVLGVSNVFLLSPENEENLISQVGHTGSAS